MDATVPVGLAGRLNAGRVLKMITLAAIAALQMYALPAYLWSSNRLNTLFTRAWLSHRGHDSDGIVAAIFLMLRHAR